MKNNRLEKTNYKVTIGYDGTRYRGWQRLKNDQKSIQFKIEEVLSKLYNKEIKIIGAGRTDAGVHAHGQVANYHENNQFSHEEILNYLNHYLPEDIAITSIEIVPELFHARYNARLKQYQYKIWNKSYANVFDRKYSYHILEGLDIEAMVEGAKHFEGQHDFIGFSTKSKKKNTVKTIEKVNLTYESGMIVIDFYGQGFLYNMVRIMVGTLIEIGQNSRKIESIDNIFKVGNRELAGFTAPAKGLCLINIDY